MFLRHGRWKSRRRSKIRDRLPRGDAPPSHRYLAIRQKFDKNFIAISQNGLELITKDGSASGELRRDYLREASAVGAESLLYGYWGYDEPTHADASEYMLKLCRLYAQNSVRVLVTDYCSAASDVNASYRRSKENGFISFAADKRNLTAVPKCPNAQYNANAKDTNTVADAENFLYLINSEKFSTKRQFIDALKIRITIS